MTGVVTILPIIALFVPGIGVIAGPMIFAGFALLSIVILIATFRRNKLGPAAQWSEPLIYLAIKFTKNERLMMLACFGIIVSGILVLLASALALRY